MPSSRSDRLSKSSIRSARFFLTAFLLVALSLSSSVLAEGTSADEDTPEPLRAERVYEINGAMIRWDLDRREVHPPTAEQAERLAAEIKTWMAVKSGEVELPSVQDIEVDTLPNGARRARLPLHLIHTSVARTGLEGELDAGFCSESPRRTHALLSAPWTSSEEAVR